VSSLRRIAAVSGKEFPQLSRDRMTFGMIIVIPLVQLLLFGYAINTVVRDIPVAVVDLSGSAAARAITEQVRVSQVVNIVSQLDTPAQAEAAVIAGEVRAALIFPPDLPRRIAQGETTGQWLVDGSDTMVSSALLALRSMPLKLSPGVPEGAYQAPQPSFEVSLFFNPERLSAVNIVPGLTAVVLTMTMILFTALALVQERERELELELGNMELLITTPVRPIELMVAKLVPYVLVGLLRVVIILGLGRLIFHVPFQGGLATLAICTVATTQLQAMQLTIFVVLPTMLLSGFMFPYDAMPVAAQYIAEALPATHYVTGARCGVARCRHRAADR